MPDPVTAIVGGSVLGAGASIYGASKSSKAAKHAADQSTAEQRRQFDLVRADTAPYRQVGVNALDKLSQLYGLGSSSAPLSYEEWLGQNPQYRSGDAFGRVGTGDIMRGPGGFSMPSGMISGIRGMGDSRAAYQKYLDSQPKGGSGSPDMSVFWESPDYRFNLAEGQKAIDNSLVAKGGALSGAGVKAGIRYASGMASREYGSFYDRLANLAGIGQTGVAQSAASGANAANNISSAYMNAGAQRGSAYMAGAEGFNNAVQGGLGNFMLNKYLGG